MSKSTIKTFGALLAIMAIAMGGLFPLGVANAAINSVSPGRNFANFPAWYQDLASGGSQLQLCLGQNPDGTGLADPNCVLPTVPPLEPNYDPTQPIAFPANFPGEAFYYIADSEISAIGTDPDRARLRIALEAAFAGTAPAAGQQITFLRVNLAGIAGLAPSSTYTVNYPFGTFDITTDINGDTVDTSNASYRAEDPITPVAISILPTAYELLLPATDTHVASFLKGTTAVPAGYIGDGVTPQQITGGTAGNIFSITASAGPALAADIDPVTAGPQISIQTNLFSVAGKLFAPTISEVTPVAVSTNNTTPDYTFTSNDIGTIDYTGDCGSADTIANLGNNLITFDTPPLGEGLHNNCTITVTNAANNVSNVLNVTPFTVDTTAPFVAEVTAVTDPTTDSTPNYVFSSTEAGTITYGGSCSSATTTTTAGDKTVTFNALAPGLHDNCTVMVTDAAGNPSNIQAVTAFTVDVPTAPVYRFYNQSHERHFYTISGAERDSINATLSHAWKDEGIGYQAYESQVANTSPVYRFYNAARDTHFFTISSAERDSINATLSHAWKDEGIAYYAYQNSETNATPIYRFYNAKQDTHFFTISSAERDSINATLSHAWKDEGIGYYVPTN